MSLPVTTPIDADQYGRVMAHASREPDYVYLGSVGEGPARGSFSGFSACARDVKRVDTKPGKPIDTDSLATSMEAVVDEFHGSESGARECLTGGWIGFVSYEFGYAKEGRLEALCPALPMPALFAGFYLWMASYNRMTGKHYLWIHPRCPDRIRHRLEHWLTVEPPSSKPTWRMLSPFQPRQSENAFKNSVRIIRNYIEAGDCYQANLSQEFQGTYQGSPWLAFQALSEANPTPYSAFIRAGEHSVLSISPERFLEIQGKTISTSPIKGTRPRGDNVDEDIALAHELQASEKDRAENLMIVDLLRNDLSLNAATGTVRVEKLFALESYRNVHHLVSHIHAELAEGVTPLKALFDAFPGGSITGAPKIRAMEIIHELEPHWRGPYCGSVFYRGLDGTLDSNIAIRTMLCDGEGKVRCWGGGGIVSDSDPDSEYQETLTKVRPLMAFLESLQGAGSAP